jgi:hypothetical protein
VTVPNGADAPVQEWIGVFRAAGGERNALTMRERSLSTMEFTDAGALITGQPLVDGAGCAPLGDGLMGVLCEPVRHVEAYLGNQDDQAHFTMSIGRALIWTGAGDDIVRADSFGNYTQAFGEAGNDDLAAGGEGGQLVDGGPGDDRLHVGGFAGDATGLGGPGRDRMSWGIGLANTGSGQLEGGPGDDHISLDTPGFATAHGDGGADLIEVTTETFGNFQIFGDGGADTLSAGPRADVIDGGAGADVIDATAGGSDTIACGAGEDTVHADAADVIAGDCEHVTIEPGATL